MSVGRICSRSVDLVDPDEDIRTAAVRMRDRDVGMLIAVDDAGRPIGVVSDRDLVTRVLAGGHPVTAPVRTVMTAKPCSIAEEAPIESALSIMAFGGVRRLPVVDRSGRLIGVIALDDVMSLLSEELGMIGKLLSSQIPCQQDPLRNSAPRALPIAAPARSLTR
jgi:signal-transduction protein with cAMP-binding, CBS, and nucleotidyltransferase domain